MEEKKTKLHGWLIVNEFLTTSKFTEHTKWLLNAATLHNVSMDVFTNAECMCTLENNADGSLVQDNQALPDFVLFWDKDVRLAHYLECLNIPVVNSAKSIADCDDKSLTHLILQSNGIRMPKTMIAPMTYPNIGYTNLDFLETVARQLAFPLIIKECFGSFGAQVYKAANKSELVEIVQRIGAKPMIFQEFIKSSEGKDIRLQVVGDKVVAAMYRYSEHNDFRANISNGGSMKLYEPSEQEKFLAVQCCKLLGLTFGGVDLLFGEGEERYVCEVNSNAHFKNIYECTKVDTAACMIEEIKRLLTKER